MSYTPTIWANGKAPALNADNLNKIENELVKLGNDVSMIEGELSSLAEVVEKPDITSTTSTTMPNSYSGRLKVDEIVGECQQFTTTGKNLLDCSGLTEQTKNGITLTPVYENGMLQYINVNGTSTARTDFTIGENSNITERVIIVNGVNGGTNSTYSMFMSLVGNTTTYESVYNTEKTITIADDVTYYNVKIRVNEGQTVSNVKFYPMIRPASITDATYEPYTNGASPNPSYPQETKSVKGYKNLLDCRGLATKTVSGVTFTPKYDGNGNLLYIEANGTATADIYHQIKEFDFSQGCIVSGCPSGGSLNSYFLNVAQHSNDYGSGTTVNDGQRHIVYIGIKSGYTANKLRFYPMIRKASIADSTYVPYGMWGVKTHGKNMFNGVDQHYYLNGSCTQSGVNQGDTGFVLKVDGGTYTVSTKVVQARFRVACSNGLVESFGISFACYNGVNKDNRDTITSITIDCTGYSYLIVNATDLSAIQVEEGSVATAYEPYTESTIALSTELYGIGDVKDVIEGGKVKRKYKKVNLKALSFMKNPLQSDSGAYIYYTNNTSDNPKNAQGLCTHFKVMENSAVRWESLNAGEMLIISNAFVVAINDIATVEEFNEYINTNNVEMVYELVTHTTEELPIADQIALNSLSTYDGITYLEFDSEIEPTFKGEYGTSKVGGYTLEGMLASRNGELLAQSNANRITALEATVVNNI